MHARARVEPCLTGLAAAAIQSLALANAMGGLPRPIPTPSCLGPLRGSRRLPHRDDDESGATSRPRKLPKTKPKRFR
jgi:hypothetical protein